MKNKTFVPDKKTLIVTGHAKIKGEFIFSFECWTVKTKKAYTIAGHFLYTENPWQMFSFRA